MYEHFKGDEVFVKKILEYQEQALTKQRLICTKFLNPHHQLIVNSVIGNNTELKVVAQGGIVNSENKKMIIAPNFYEIEDDDFSITLVKIRYASHYDTLKHSDVLGALMSLGVKRELFGDIVEKQGDFYLALDTNIYEYVKDTLVKIKRSKIMVTSSDEVIENIQEYTSKNFIVSSLRLDKVVSAFYHVSRSKAGEYIQSGFVKVNHKVVVEMHYLCNNRDIISLKKHGRVVFVNTTRKTKSDNYVIEGYFYQ